MKTKQDIQAEIDEVSDQIRSGNLSEFQEKKSRKRIVKLRELIKYFDYDLSDGLIEKMKEDCENKIRIYEKRAQEWIASKAYSELDKIKNPTKFYYENIAPKDLLELKLAKEQLLNVNYLLV